MSVYIKGMDMPVDCLACWVSCRHETYQVTGRPEGCPLEEAKDGDLISRADAIEAVWKEYEDAINIGDNGDAIAYDVEKILSALPSAESVQGEWKHKPSKSGEWVWWQCSECGAVIYSESEVDRKIHHAYCGVCGARMKGGEQNDD